MRIKEKDLIKYKDGNLYCELADIWIDPNKPVKRALITHAHFDHFTFGCEEYISTNETATLLKERVGDNIKIKTFEYEEELEKIKSYFETGKNVSDEVINLNKVKSKSSSKNIVEKVKIKYFANRLIRKS